MNRILEHYEKMRNMTRISNFKMVIFDLYFTISNLSLLC